VTFAPDPPSRTGMSNTVRTVLSWVLMVAMVVVLWQIATKKGRFAASTTYSDFLSQVDKNNVASAKLYTSQSTAEVYGTLRQPARDFKVTIPRETIPDLTERLRKQGVTIEVSGSPQSDWRSLALTVVPFVLFYCLWIFTIMQRRAKRVQPQSASSEPPGRPLG
jgi:cell division protease FtsH